MNGEMLYSNPHAGGRDVSPYCVWLPPVSPLSVFRCSSKYKEEEEEEKEEEEERKVEEEVRKGGGR